MLSRTIYHSVTGVEFLWSWPEGSHMYICVTCAFSLFTSTLHVCQPRGLSRSLTPVRIVFAAKGANQECCKTTWLCAARRPQIEIRLTGKTRTSANWVSKYVLGALGPVSLPIWLSRCNTHCLSAFTLQLGGRQKHRAGGHSCPLNATLEQHWNQRQRQRKSLIHRMHKHYRWWRPPVEGCDISTTLSYYRCHTAALHHPISKDECQHFGATPKRTIFAQRCEKLGVT